jgi:hypothetical protein
MSFAWHAIHVQAAVVGVLMAAVLLHPSDISPVSALTAAAVVPVAMWSWKKRRDGRHLLLPFAWTSFLVLLTGINAAFSFDGHLLENFGPWVLGFAIIQPLVWFIAFAASWWLDAEHRNAS